MEYLDKTIEMMKSDDYKEEYREQLVIIKEEKDKE